MTTLGDLSAPATVFAKSLDHGILHAEVVTIYALHHAIEWGMARGLFGAVQIVAIAAFVYLGWPAVRTYKPAVTYSSAFMLRQAQHEGCIVAP